jgi:hypothetical protein
MYIQEKVVKRVEEGSRKADRVQNRQTLKRLYSMHRIVMVKRERISNTPTLKRNGHTISSA